MASQAPSPEIRQENFEQGVACALNLWPDLTMAVRDSLGGPDSADKRDWLCGAVVELFPAFTSSNITAATTTSATNGDAPPASGAGDELDNSDIQEFLANVMLDEFELVLEEGDRSLWQVAEQIVRIRRGCAAGNFANVEMLQKRWEEGKGRKVENLYKKAEDPDQDTDWDSEDDEDDDDGGDVEMDEAPPLVRVPKEKPPPDVDEDGFTKVSRKKR